MRAATDGTATATEGRRARNKRRTHDALPIISRIGAQEKNADAHSLGVSIRKPIGQRLPTSGGWRHRTKQEHQNGPGQQIELDHGRLQKPAAGAASREKPDSQPNQQVVGGIPAAVFVEHDFAGRLVRILLKAGEPWFVAADVCRALQLASHKGSRAAHLDKLDDDEKLQISREASSRPP